MVGARAGGRGVRAPRSDLRVRLQDLGQQGGNRTRNGGLAEVEERVGAAVVHRGLQETQEGGRVVWTASAQERAERLDDDAETKAREGVVK